MRPYGPLRGRDEELASALGVVRRTHVYGAGGVVLVSGDVGIGKTALISETCRRATPSRIRLARSKCDEIGQACPGAPIIGLLRSGRDPLLTASEFKEIAGLTGEPLVLVDRIAGHLERLAAADCMMIAVDDVQWSDRLSRYALRSLVSRLAGQPVVWMVASRSAAAGLTVSAADTVGVEHIRLAPLPRSAIAEIARDRLSNSVTDRVDELLDAAGGNPLLATQIIDGAARHAETNPEESDYNGSEPQSLTQGERRVVYLVADGYTDKSAAKALGISVNTVGIHLRSAYSKLGVQSRVQLVNALRERGELN